MVSSEQLFRVCPDCGGTGRKTVVRTDGEGYDITKCFKCSGNGFSERYPRTPLDDYLAMTCQARWLRKRYGKVQISIKDYWK